MTATCSFDGCVAKVHARGICNKHYQRFHRSGTLPGTSKADETLADRLLCNVRLDGPRPDRTYCMTRTTSGDGRGYTNIKVAGQHQKAHRVAYLHWFGPIPDGLVLDHLCLNKACINPAHLEPVTVAENNRRARELVGASTSAGPLPPAGVDGPSGTVTDLLSGRPVTAPSPASPASDGEPGPRSNRSGGHHPPAA